MKNTFLKFWKIPAQLIYMVMLLLVLIGGINVLSASFVTARDMTGDGLSFFKKYLFFACFGSLVMYVVRRLGYRFWRLRWLWGLRRLWRPG